MRPSRSVVLFALTASSISVYANALQDKRAAADLCANVNGNLGLLGALDANLNLCLCLSALPTLLMTNTQLRVATQLLGASAVTAAVTALVR